MFISGKLRASVPCLGWITLSTWYIYGILPALLLFEHTSYIYTNALNRFKAYTGTEICQHGTSCFHVVKLLVFKTQHPHTGCLYYLPGLCPENAIWSGSNCTRCLSWCTKEGALILFQWWDVQVGREGFCAWENNCRIQAVDFFLYFKLLKQTVVIDRRTPASLYHCKLKQPRWKPALKSHDKEEFT